MEQDLNGGAPQNAASRRPIKILNAETARKIAAGEVIDRPASIVRELLDNAVDSGASQISVEIQGGGIEKIRVQDDGCGMSREDLLACARPHATSKIASDTDLLSLTTLGFRGEALASIAAVSRLSIDSGEWRMRASISEDHVLEPRAPIAGTTVTSENLFENFPARRQFLKRPASETKMCRQMFLEKALPRPDIAFRLFVDGEMRNDFLSGQSLKERFRAALAIQQSEDLFYEIKGSGQGFSFSLVIADPCLSRQDRKDIYIYVNGRRIAEYSLLQAIEYGAQGYFPNGTHPAAALFASVRPDLVDFNIHPAKKEARFKDIAPLHHGISSSLREFFRALSVKQMKGGLDGRRDFFGNPLRALQADGRGQGAEGAFFAEQSGGALFKSAQGLASLAASESPQSADYGSAGPEAPSAFAARPYQTVYGAGKAPRISERPPLVRAASPKTGGRQGAEFSQSGAAWKNESALGGEPFSSAGFLPPEERIAGGADFGRAREGTSAIIPENSFRYIGRALGTFIIVEKNNALYFVDQHAAHERFLFDRIMDGQGQKQRLLIPEKMELESDGDERYMEGAAEELARFGFECGRTGDCEWTFTALNSLWKGGLRELKQLIFEKRIEPKELIRKIAATAACRSAVKDGDVLDDAAAEDLAKKAFALPDPHCPHGRPCWTAVTKERFFELVKRT